MICPESLVKPFPAGEQKNGPGFPGPDDLHGAFISERIEPVIANDDVVQDTDFKQCAGIFDLFGDFQIRFAWNTQPRRMVVTLM